MPRMVPMIGPAAAMDFVLRLNYFGCLYMRIDCELGFAAAAAGDGGDGDGYVVE